MQLALSITQSSVNTPLHKGRNYNVYEETDGYQCTKRWAGI
jgi:hypothetical protein